MKKKTLLALVTIALVGIGGYVAVTGAFFSARRTTTGNKFTVGTLDLQVGSGVSDPFVVENIGASGDISGGKTWTIKNTGSLPGRLFMRLRNLVNNNGGCINDFKKAADANCLTPTAGNLGAKLLTSVSLDGTKVFDGPTLATDQQESYGTQWAALPNVIIPAGESKTVGLTWAASETSYGNEIQGDSTQFDVEFNLVQLTNVVPTNTQ